MFADQKLSPPSARQAKIHGFQKRRNQTKNNQGKPKIEKSCKHMCSSIRRKRRSKIPMAQRTVGRVRNRNEEDLEECARTHV